MFGSNGLNSIFEREHVVGGMQCVCKTEIDFMLPYRHFVMPYLYVQTHAVQCIHQFGPDSHGFIVCGKVEITAHIVGYWVDALTSISSEKEKLRLGADIICPASISDIGKHPF